MTSESLDQVTHTAKMDIRRVKIGHIHVHIIQCHVNTAI